jgi:hypothetical protein
VDGSVARDPTTGQLGRDVSGEALDALSTIQVGFGDGGVKMVGSIVIL